MNEKQSSGIPQSWLAHDKKVKPYVWEHRSLGILKTVVGLLFIAHLLFSDYINGHEIQNWIEARVSADYLRWLLYFGILGLVWGVIAFPLDLSGHLIEVKHGLSKQTIASWLWDKAKGLLLGAVLGAVVMALLYFSIHVFPDIWWVVACTLFVLFSIVLAQLTPVLLIPLFFKLKPMENGTLKERLLNLCMKFKVEVKDVYTLGLGEKTEKGNAAFVGLGRTKRIIIGDTLYEKYSHDEVEAVFAHELGHQVHNDLWKGIGWSAATIYLSFFLAQKVFNGFFLSYFLGDAANIDKPFGLLIFFTVLSIIQWPIGVAQAAYSRSRENAADEFASKNIGVNAKLADALEKLTFQNYSFFLPNTILEFLTYSHPAPSRRIMALRKG